MFYGLYHGNSPSNHHLGEYVFNFILPSQANLRYDDPCGMRGGEFVQGRFDSVRVKKKIGQWEGMIQVILGDALVMFLVCLFLSLGFQAPST